MFLELFRVKVMIKDENLDSSSPHLVEFGLCYGPCLRGNSQDNQINWWIVGDRSIRDYQFDDLWNGFSSKVTITVGLWYR